MVNHRVPSVCKKYLPGMAGIHVHSQVMTAREMDAEALLAKTFCRGVNRTLDILDPLITPEKIDEYLSFLSRFPEIATACGWYTAEAESKEPVLLAEELEEMIRQLQSHRNSLFPDKTLHISAL